MASVPTPPIFLGDFLVEFKKNFLSPTESKDESVLPFYLNTTSPVSAEIEATFQIDAFTLIDLGSENRAKVLDQTADVKVLKTARAFLTMKNTSRQNPFNRTQYSARPVEVPKPLPANENLAVGYKDLEITVRLYRPPRASHRGYKVESPVFAEEFVCLGSNFLTDLRDKISCVCKGKRFVDISEDPEAPLPTLDTDPAYFFIHDTFYNDRRNPKNCDYSEHVLKWAPLALGEQGENFKVASMETTRFVDLTVSLGTPLQYLHHGNCEHLFVISQVEVLTPQSQIPDRSMYPYLRSFNNYNRRTCFMCGLRKFYFIVEQSPRQLFDPTYLCRNCFYNFHYINGKKVGQFKAYRIYDFTENQTEEDDVVEVDTDQSYECTDSEIIEAP